MAHPPRAPGVRAWFWSTLFCLVSSFCSSQTYKVVCSNAYYGKFEVKFNTGVSVSVGPAANGGFFKRVCEARLRWDKQSLVVAEAWQIDIDALGADLGLGVHDSKGKADAKDDRNQSKGEPVVAFQVKKSDADPSMTYQIYSLEKPPRLLRTITGGDFFSAADTDLDGRIEIWTGDARAVDGFENLALSELDFAPTLLLRFEHHRLMDVSSQFRSHFDRQIENVRARLDSQKLRDFKNSDGKLSAPSPLPVEQLLRLRTAKIKVLKICLVLSLQQPRAGGMECTCRHAASSGFCTDSCSHSGCPDTRCPQSAGWCFPESRPLSFETLYIHLRGRKGDQYRVRCGELNQMR